MGTPLVLTFDIGTQSARCLLVKPDGSFQDICQLKYDEPYYSRKPGWAEQRPDFYYDRICEAGKTGKISTWIGDSQVGKAPP